jgi:hypothetical protein
MTQQLKGKIYWILDDFAYIGAVIPKKDDTAHIVARLDNVVIDEHMIKFYVCPHKSTDGQDWSYNVNLLINDTATKFNGTFTEATEPSYKGEVYSELFSNHKKYMLQGRWIEDETIYTFWAIIDKE